MENHNQHNKRNYLNIVLIGPECTGKTTLSKALAKHYNTSVVPEYSRIYAEESKHQLTYKDVLPITEGQYLLEVKHRLMARQILFFDTNLLQTKIYSQWYYNQHPEKLDQYIKISNYDFYFLNSVDVPWQPDGIRDQPTNRLELFFKFVEALNRQYTPFTILKGSIEDRIKKALYHINRIYC